MRIAEVKAPPTGLVGCSSDPNEKCGHGLEKIYPTAAVRYGYLKHIGEFSYKPGMKFTCGGSVVIHTDRGIEIGMQVSLTCTGCSKSVTREQMRTYAQNSGEGYLQLKCGKILREASTADLHEERHIRAQIKEKLDRCVQLIRQYDLPMKLVDCEHVFGGERIIFYFMADNRVDFRQLVKELAQEYHTRIEMRQVGARDEARLVADYETCGQECCCKTFLKTLKPISMRMAKLQKATLDPSKVSGRCGRLKCCLRYEHETYEELERKLPKIGQAVRTPHGSGMVVDRQILTQLVQIELDDLKRIYVVAEDILPLADPIEEKAPQKPEPPEPRAKLEAGTPPAEEQAAQKKKRRRRRRRSRKAQHGTEENSADPSKE